MMTSGRMGGLDEEFARWTTRVEELFGGRLPPGFDDDGCYDGGLTPEEAVEEWKALSAPRKEIARVEMDDEGEVERLLFALDDAAERFRDSEMLLMPDEDLTPLFGAEWKLCGVIFYTRKAVRVYLKLLEEEGRGDD